jgi:1-acyl-sn-glycerol-3-phosphate acyltransferase
MLAEGEPFRAHYSRLAFGVFDLFLRPWRSRRLIVAPIAGLPPLLPADRPLVIVANHTSWWDGFLLRDVHMALRPQAPMYSVMTRAELVRFPFLRLLGAVPLDTASPGSLLRLLRSLRSATRARPDSTILFFPQGRIWPAWKRPLGFKRGVELLARAIGPCFIIPVGVQIESLNRCSPTAFTKLGPVISSPEQTVTVEWLEREVASQLDDIASLLALHGEAAVHHMRHMEAV